ncbi:uncharacterized protein LOC115215172 isoform X1 [Octopus sinensis]|uniref:Uncharacterized protein LOC115215172 isoform X1 n=1 Tax=Octopus sinensis TaxID=2607531 RepID=A0A7E6F0G0_9MOLL|nr:uncharacterized protein LOC115215172 isoform X1 [Octopus sinensis]
MENRKSSKKYNKLCGIVVGLCAATIILLIGYLVTNFQTKRKEGPILKVNWGIWKTESIGNSESIGKSESSPDIFKQSTVQRQLVLFFVLVLCDWLGECTHSKNQDEPETKPATINQTSDLDKVI